MKLVDDEGFARSFAFDAETCSRALPDLVADVAGRTVAHRSAERRMSSLVTGLLFDEEALAMSIPGCLSAEQMPPICSVSCG
jgi:hypothetical protein